MAVKYEADTRQAPELPADFTERLEASLPQADQYRRRYVLAQRMRKVLPLILLVGPIAGWRLIVATGDGVHIAIGAVSWLAFVLDVGVHVNAAILSYLGLQALPSIVGIILFVLVTVTLLHSDRKLPWHAGEP